MQSQLKKLRQRGVTLLSKIPKDLENFEYLEGKTRRMPDSFIIRRGYDF